MGSVLTGSKGQNENMCFCGLKLCHDKLPLGELEYSWTLRRSETLFHLTDSN